MPRINFSDVGPHATAGFPRSSASPLGFTPMAGGFIVGGPWAAMYRAAYEQAVAATQPSRFQRMAEPCWN